MSKARPEGRPRQRRSVPSSPSNRLPSWLRRFFWEYRFNDLSWEADRDLVIQRLLTAGDWRAPAWLRRRLTDRALREWIEQYQGARLAPKPLRF